MRNPEQIRIPRNQSREFELFGQRQRSAGRNEMADVGIGKGEIGLIFGADQQGKTNTGGEAADEARQKIA